MTGREVIQWADTLAPNQYSAEQKLAWLSDLDGKFWLEVLTQYHHKEELNAPEAYTDGSETLLIPAPYARDVYGNWLLAKIAEANQEIALYNQHSTLFNAEYRGYCEQYNKRHKAIHGGSWIF